MLAFKLYMELNEINQQVDEKLAKLDDEIERFKINIESCDELEQRQLLEKDLDTLHVIREKLIKAKGLAQQVTDLKQQVENPSGEAAKKRFLNTPTWLTIALISAAALVGVGWVWQS